MTDTPKIFPLGDSALTVDFGNEISIPLNDRALALAAFFEDHPFPGFVEAVPAYSSVAIYYDLVEVRSHFSERETAFDAVRDLVNASLSQLSQSAAVENRTIEIPVSFSDDVALDLNVVAEHSGMTRSDVIEVFTQRSYRVYMLGFLPGFAYMGEVDDRIAVPRRDSPRLKVPKGSVGIGGRQTGIYPLESPGGWQIIARTDLEMFTPDAATPCLLGPGDEVRFVPTR